MSKMAWTTSDRRSRLPHDWPQLRITVLERDPICRACHRRPSTDVDHKIRGDDHSLANLQGLCALCHRRKTASEAVDARRRPPRRRPAEAHPGEVQPKKSGPGVGGTPGGRPGEHRTV